MIKRIGNFNFVRLCIYNLILVSLLFPLAIHAQTGPIVTCQENCGWPELLTEVGTFIKVLLYLSAGVATFSFSYAGFLYITSGGNPSQIEKAKGVFVKVLIGFIIAFTAWLVVHEIIKAVGLNQNASVIKTT